MKPITKHVLATSVVWLIGGAAVSGLFIWSGIYNAAADAPHTAIIYTLLDNLAPGKNESELSKGLYPSPPNLAKYRVEPAPAFWIIKHGIKASGMPAWGKSMKDEYIWNMAAFLQKLPDMNQQQYLEMVDNSGGHSHGGGESDNASRHGRKKSGHDQGGEGLHGSADKPPSQVKKNSVPADTAAKKAEEHHGDGHKH